MRIGVLGLGFIGLPVANALHHLGHEVFSCTRNQKNTEWENSVSPNVLAERTLEVLVIASGATRPGLGDVAREIETTLGLVENLNLNSLEHIYYISSGAVYGECIRPMSELESPKPSTDYGRAKLSAEFALRNLFQNRFTSLRVGNVVDWESPYGLFREISNISNGNYTLDFFGEVSSARDYLDMNSFVEILSNLISSHFNSPTLNIGSGDSPTLGQIAEVIKKVAQQKIEIRWHPSRPQDVKETRLDVGLLRTISEVTPAAFLSLFEFFMRDVITD